MANLSNEHLLMFQEKFEAFKKGRGSDREMSQNQIADNIEQEGFFGLPNCNDARFISGVYDIMLNNYVAAPYQESELSQMWRIFRTLYNNGIKPNDNLSRQLYLRLAKETVINSSFGKPVMGRLEVRDKADLIVTGLNSFDTSKYFFRTLRVIEQDGDSYKNFYIPYYSEFISAIASLCPNEQLLYSIIAERVSLPTKTGRLYDRAREIVQSTGEIADFLRYEGHSMLREEKGKLLGKTSEQLIKSHDELTDPQLISQENNIEGQFPQYIKIPSCRRYM